VQQQRQHESLGTPWNLRCRETLLSIERAREILG
jgi:hypothetical protein